MSKRRKEEVAPPDFNDVLNRLSQGNFGQTSVGQVQGRRVPEQTEFDLEKTGQTWSGQSAREVRDQMAVNQPNSRALLNSVFQIGTTIVGDTVGGIGYLGEVKDVQDIVQGTETEWGNWLTNIGDNIKEWGQEAAPVYASQEALEGFKPWDGEWWATNIPSIGSTVALMLPAAGAAGITSKLLSRAGNAAKMASRLSTTQKVLPGISAAVTSRHIENMMEGKEVFDTIYNKALQEGKSEEEARGIAGRAASTSYNTNYVNLLTDIPQYLALGGFKFGKGPAKTGLKAQVGDYASQMGQEAIEEATQFVIGQEAERQGLQELYGEDGTSFGQRLSNYLKNPQLWTSSFFGAIGGGVFQGIGKLADTLTATDRQEQSAVNITNESIEQGDFEKPKQTLAQFKQTNPEDLGGVTPEEWSRNIEQAENLVNHTEQTYNSLEGNPNRVELTKLSRDAKLVEQKNTNALTQLEQIKANFKDTKSFDAFMNKLQLSALSNVTGDEAKAITTELNKQLEGIEEIDTSQFRAYLPQMRKIAKQLALNKVASSKIDEQIQSYEDPSKAKEREKQQKEQEQKLEKQQYQARLKKAELSSSPDELDRLDLTPEDKSKIKQEKVAKQRKEAPVKPKSFESIGEVASYVNERYNNRPFLEESELAGRTKEELIQSLAKRDVETVKETPTQEPEVQENPEPEVQNIPDGTRSFYETKSGKQQDVIKKDGVWRRLLKSGRVGTEVKNENQIEQANENAFVKSEEPTAQTTSNQSTEAKKAEIERRKQEDLENKVKDLQAERDNLRSENGVVPPQNMSKWKELNKEIIDAKRQAKRADTSRGGHISIKSKPKTTNKDPKTLTGKDAETAEKIIEKIISDGISNGLTNEEIIQKINERYTFDNNDQQLLNNYISDRNSNVPEIGNNKQSFPAWRKGKYDTELKALESTEVEIEKEKQEKLDEIKPDGKSRKDRKRIIAKNRNSGKSKEEILKEAGYVEVDGLFIDPDADISIIKKIPLELWNVMRENGIVVLSFTSKGNHHMQAGSITIDGVRYGEIELTANGLDNIEHNILHEVGHKVYQSLSKKEQQKFNNYNKAVTPYVASEERNQQSGASNAEENFAESFALDMKRRLYGENHNKGLNNPIEQQYQEIFNKVNAKYDADLKALEKQETTEEEFAAPNSDFPELEANLDKEAIDQEEVVEDLPQEIIEENSSIEVVRKQYDKVEAGELVFNDFILSKKLEDGYKFMGWGKPNVVVASVPNNWTVSKSKTWQPVKGKDGLPVESSWKKPHINYDTARNLGKLYPDYKSRNVFLEIAQDDIYKDNADDIVIYTAMELEDGSVVRFGILPATNSVKAEFAPTISAIRERVYREYKNTTIEGNWFRSSVVTNVKEMTAGKFYNTKTRFNPSDLNQPLVLGVGVSTSGSPALETNGEASELGIVPTPGAVYMQVQAGNGENVWTRLFTKKLRHTDLIADKGEFEVWESLIGFREGATYLDVVRDLFTLADNPDVWKSNWKDIRTELQSIVRFTDKGKYMIDFRENLPDVVAKYGDSMGYFNYLVNKYDLTDKVVQINTREVNQGNYNQRISKRLSTTINANQYTHSPVFIIDTEVDRIESAGQDSLEGESVQDIDDIFGAFKNSVDSIPDIKQAVEYLSRALPNVPVKAIEQTVRIGNQQAYGYFSRAGIDLYKGAGLSTAKHEAGHIVFSFGLTDRQKSKLLREAKTRYTLTEQDKARAQEALDKLDTNQSVEEYALIEKIMEEFESYIVTGQSAFKSIFKRLLEMIKMAIGYAPTIESMFYRIDQGLYKNINLDSVSQDYEAYQLGGFRTIQEKYIRTKTTTVLFDSIVANIEARDKVDTNAAYVKAVRNINDLFTGDYSKYGGSIKQRLEKHKQRIKDKASSNLLERLDRYISQISEPWFQEHVIKQMSDRGIKIKYENKTIEGDDTAQENWQKSTFQYSPLESVSNKLRRVFNSLPMVTNLEGPVVKTDDLGLTRFFDGSRVYADLQTKIGFAASPEHMNQLLSEMTEPHYEFMYSRLTPELKTELWYYLSQKNKPEFHDVVNRVKYDEDNKIDSYEFLSSSVDNKNNDLLNEAYDYFINSDYYNNGELVYKDKLSTLINNVKKGGIADVLKANEELFGFNEQVLRGINNINSLFESAMNGIAQGDLTFNDRQVKNLVKKVAEKYPNTYQSSHLNIEGEKQYEWINASYLGKVVSRLNAGLFDWSKYDLDPMYSHLINTGVIDKDVWSKIKWTVVGGIKHKAKGRGTKYSSFSDRDSAIALLSMYENGFFNTSILSDAPVLTGLKLPKHKTITAINKLYELANAEYIRNTKSVEAHKSKFGKYSAGYEFFDGDEITRETISQDVDRRAEELGDKLKSLGLIEDNKFTFNQQSATFADLREIVANYQLNESLVILMTQGDPAFYKGSADFFKRAKEVWSPGQYLDTTAYYVDPQGNKVGYPTDGMYNVGVLKDIKEPSIHVDEYRKALLASGVSEEKTEKIVSEYEEVDLADGQGIVDIYTYRLREIGENRWGHAKEFAYRLITKGISSKSSDLEAELELFLEGSDVNKADIEMEVRNLIFQPIKPFYFAHHLLENVLAYPVQNKDSEYLLTPSQAEGNPELEKMLTKFGYSKTDTGWQLDEEGRAKKQYTDKFVFESGIKTNFGDQIGDLDSYTNVPFYWQDYRRQMGTPEHYRDVDNRFGSQIMKLLVSDLPESLQPLKREYEQLIKEDIERSLEQLNNRFKGLDATIDREKILNMLREEVVDRGLGDQYLEALEEIEGNTKLPLFHPLHSYRIESIVNSLYKNNVTKQSFLQGVALYNVSSYGLAKKPKVVVENDRIKHIEVYAPVYTKALEKYRKEDGSIDVNDVPEEYLTGLVYRIPTEDKYSMFNIKIIGFTDDIAGGQIIMPPDVTTIAGLDYDIDKVFGFFRAVENPYTEAISRIEEEASRVLGEQDIDSLSGPIWDGILSKLFDNKDQIKEQAVLQVIQDRGKDKVYQALKEKSEQWEAKAQSDNRKLEIMQSILSDSSMVENFLTPGGFDQIINVVKIVKKVKEQAINEDLSINSIADTITVINRMNTGKTLVGIAANYNAARALWQGYNLTMNSSFVFNDSNYNNLSSSEIVGLRPSRSLAEVLAAAVDNGKDPLAEFINFNTFTADTALTMLSTGVPMKTVAMFMSQPLIKKYTKDYFNNGEVAPDYTPDMDDSFKPSDITDSELKKGLSDMDLATEEYVGDYDRQQKMLKHFLYYMELSKPVSKLVQATKIPDSGTGPTVASNLSKISQYTDTIGKIGKSINNAENYLKADNYMKAFYDNTFLEAQNTFKELGFPDYTANAFKAIVNKLENLKGEPFSPKDFERLTTHFVDYLSMGFPKFKEKLPTIEKDTLDSLRAYKNYLKNKGLSHSFVDRLDIQDDIIRFKGVTGIDNQEEQFVRELWDEMLKDSTPINGKLTVQTLAENLVYYSFFRSGFRTAGREGFSQLIPVDFFAYLESNGQSFNQYITNQVNNINNPVHEVFVNQYIRNNYERLSYIPEVEVEIVNNKPMTKDLTAPKYVKNDGKLYEHNKGFLQPIPALGLTKSRKNKSDVKLFYEYYTGVEDPTSIFNNKPITAEALPKTEEKPSEQAQANNPEKQYSLNTEQTAAYNKMKEFAGSNKSGWFMLEGKAGTGKTFTASEFIKDQAKKGNKVLFGALSHKATNVLNDKITEAFGGQKPPSVLSATVAKMTGANIDLETGKFQIDPFTRSILGDYDVIIIDEASMINEEALATIKKDMYKGAKLYFLGDSGQLPPIRETNDQFKDKDSPTFGTPNKARLLTRVRQGEQSPILPYADYYWNNSQSENPVKSPAPQEQRQTKQTAEGNLIFTPKPKAMKIALKEFRKAVDNKDPNVVKIVAYRNNTRKAINKYVRDSIFNANEEFVEGDIVMFFSPYQISQELLLQNSDEFSVVKSRKDKITRLGIDYNGYMLTFDLTDANGLKVQEEIPVIASSDKQKFQSKLQELFREAAKLPKRSQARREAYGKAWGFKNSVANIDYSYAITSHKSQGSTYNTVIVYESDIMGVGPISNKAKSQSMYTAITRAKNNAIIIDNNAKAQDVSLKEDSVTELFESNPELANQVYSALGFVNNTQFNKVISLIADNKNYIGGSAGLFQQKLLNRTPNDIDLISFEDNIDDLIIKLKSKSLGINKISNKSLLVNNIEVNIDFLDKDILNSKEEFIKGFPLGKQFLKDGKINPEYLLAIKKIDNREKDISDLKNQITPQQKLEAQQKFQEYVDTTGKQDIEGFKNFIQSQEQSWDTMETVQEDFTQGVEEIIDTAWLNYGPRINAKRVAAGYSLTTPDKFAESAKKMIEEKGVDYFNEIMKKCYS